MAKRKRWVFPKEFKAQAVRILRESGNAVGTVARELDLTETALRSWVRQAKIGESEKGPELTGLCPFHKDTKPSLEDRRAIRR